MAPFFKTLILSTGLIVALAIVGFGQTAAKLPSVQEIEQVVTQLGAEKNPSADATALLTISQELLNTLRGLETQTEAKAAFDKKRASIESDLAKVTEESNKTDTAREPPAEADLDGLTKTAQSIELERKAEVSKLQGLTSETTRRAERAAQLPEQIVAARNELARLRSLSVETAPSDPVLALRQTQLRSANLARQEATLNALETESAFYPEASELLNAQVALSEAKVERLTAEAKAWQEAASNARSADASAIAAEAETRAADQERHPYLRKLDQAISILAEQRIGENGTTTQRQQAANRKLEVDAQLNELKVQYADARQQLSLIQSANLDLGDTTGKLLLEWDKQLPNLKDLRKELEGKVKTAAALFIEMKGLERNIRSEAGNLDAAIEEGLLEAQKEQTIEEDDIDAFKTALKGNLEQRRELLVQLKEDKESLRSDLSKLTVDLQALIALVENFKLYVDESIPWLRSQAPWTFGMIRQDTSQVASLIDSEQWPTMWQSLQVALRKHAHWWLAVGLIVAVLMRKRQQLKNQLAHLAETVRPRSCRNFRATLHAVLVATLLLAPWVFLIWFPAWSVSRIDSGSYTEAILHVGGFVFFFSALYEILRPNGLAEAHLGMAEATRSRLHRALKAFAPCYVVVFLVVHLYRRTPVDPALNENVSMLDGRTFYILQMLLLGAFLHKCTRILLPTKVSKIKRIAVYSLAIGIPLGLLATSLLGYHYAVVELERRLQITAWFTLGALLLYFFIKRGIRVARWRLRRQELLAAQALRKAEAEGTEVDQEELVDAQAPDATSAHRQSDRLVRAFSIVLVTAGLFAIWSDLLPALKVLDRITVWPAHETTAPVASSNTTNATTLVPGVPASSTPTATVASEPSTGVSLADIFLALLAFFLTYIAVQNIPGLLEVSILQNVQLRPGSSYAISSIVRYVIVVVGLMIGFGMLGINWGKVQWLAAAVTVGIGFGLQEIFANFVAGLILLFERPMRVGDVVSVGNTSGKVSQIRMRATTITAFNKQELVVPNKAFITSEFINWTLSDSVLRAEVAVGVAYGSDVEQTKAILERVGAANELTLDEPAPQVLFSAFGASTLDFELRVHVSSVGDLVNVRSQLHFAINKAFAEAGIEIAFPQLDVNLKSDPSAATTAKRPSES